jgi:hypothetical protein
MSWQQFTLKLRELVSKIFSNPRPMIPEFEFIEPFALEIEDKTGTFLNPRTGGIWELYVENRRITVKVPNFSFQLSPLSPTIFRPANPAVNLEFEFERPDPNHPWFMHVYAKGIKRATFETLTT